MCGGVSLKAVRELYRSCVDGPWRRCWDLVWGLCLGGKRCGIRIFVGLEEGRALLKYCCEKKDKNEQENTNENKRDCRQRLHVNSTPGGLDGGRSGCGLPAAGERWKFITAR